MNVENENNENLILIESSFDYGDSGGSAVIHYIWYENDCSLHFEDRIKEDEMDYFLDYIYENIGFDDENIPGVILEDVSSHNGGAYDGYYYDIYVEKKFLKKAGEFLIEAGNEIINEYIELCNQK